MFIPPHLQGSKWLSGTRTKRKSQFIQIKNRIRNSDALYGGLFWCEDYLSDNTQFVDGYIVSAKYPGIFYNLTLTSGPDHIRSRIEELAHDELHRRAKETYTGYSDLDVYEALGAQYYTQLKEITKELSSGPLPSLHPHAEFDLSYSFGIGLHATVADNGLSWRVVHEFAEDFLARGEVAYVERSVVLHTPPASAFKPNICNMLMNITSNAQAQESDICKKQIEEVASYFTSKKEAKIMRDILQPQSGDISGPPPSLRPL